VKKLVRETLNELMAEIPTKISGSKNTDEEILRIGIIAELDAINLYEQMASQTNNKKLKKLLLDIAKEEKTHVGELQAFLLSIDKEQSAELKTGEKEYKKI
jgi:rubrerythrin